MHDENMLAPPRRDLSGLFDPRSVAVVGASARPGTWGHILAAGALAGAHRRRVHLVNRNGGEILGQPAARSLAELPEPPELVVVAVPAAAFEETVDAACEAGARVIVGVSGGLGELGGAAARREAALAARVRAAGAALLGPNCLGIYDAAAELRLVWGSMTPGSIGVISQSGNVGLELARFAAEAQLGVSRFASIGNQADIDVVELVGVFAAHAETELIALYVEDFRDGRAFVRAAQAAGKPIVLLTAGATAAGARAARSHTGALVSDRLVVQAACRAAGVVLVRTPVEAIEVAAALLAPVRPRGRRVAIVGDGGGHNALAADVFVQHGFELPDVAPANPLDLAGRGDEDRDAYAAAVSALADARIVDTVVLTGWFGGYGSSAEVAAARSMARAAAGRRVALAVQTMHVDTPTVRVLQALRVPVFRSIVSAAAALAHALEPPAEGARDEPVAEPQRPVEGYWDARCLLAERGVQFVDARPARGLGEARAAAAALGYPVVLKRLGALHKSDSGGVQVDLLDEYALDRAYAALGASEQGYSVERMAPVDAGVELLVGAARDARFGAWVAVGLGGVLAEVLDDVAVALAPIDELQAERLLRSLRGTPLLDGARGRPPMDLAAAARAVARISEVAAANPWIAELEVNPLLVSPAGALGLDARIVTADAA